MVVVCISIELLMCAAGCACVLSASDKCQQEKRKTINGDDLLWAMSTLGFDKYVEPLKAYLAKYREVRAHGCDRHAAAADQPYASRAAAGVLRLCLPWCHGGWLLGAQSVKGGEKPDGGGSRKKAAAAAATADHSHMHAAPLPPPVYSTSTFAAAPPPSNPPTGFP